MWSARGVATHAGVLSCSAARAPQRARATSTGFFDLVYDSKRRFDLQQPQHDLQRPLKTYLQYKAERGDWREMRQLDPRVGPLHRETAWLGVGLRAD